MKTALIVTAALALTSPLALADNQQPAKPAAKTQAAGTGSAAPGAAANKPETRNWAAIDSNGDHLISPEEMQKHLEASWAAQKK